MDETVAMSEGVRRWGRSRSGNHAEAEERVVKVLRESVAEKVPQGVM